MASNLSAFGLAEMLRCSVGLRRALRGATTMEAAANAACGFLYNELQMPDGSRACALVRCYKTHPYAELEPEQQDFARKMLAPARPARDMKCLTLLSTVGQLKSWNDRRLSKGHAAIPLASPSMVERAPMIAELLRAFGLSPADVISPTKEVMRDLAGKSYGVFFVPDAANSPFIPAKHFVEKQNVRSVVGFGGSLPTGDLFATILFTRAIMEAEAADRFRNLALDFKSFFFGYDRDQIFEPQRAPDGAAPGLPSHLRP